MAYAPPFVYSHVTGITSPTGAEVEGWLITVGGTPKELMAHDPEFTYSRLLAAADMAQKLGAQIMGLGAFTKVVGDAGVTVAKRAPLPITTGNCYSASGALWAAHDALRRLGIAEVDEKGQIKGKAMVVGATGAIGSVCARLLALAGDELWLVSPEPAKLLALKADIERENPRAMIHVACHADEHLADMDVIVTATSGAGKQVLDIMTVKPGCVITDVARPLDLSAEDVAKRPDVLVIESGEIELPGDVQMRDIGLPERRRLRLPGRDHRPGARGPLRDVHRRAQHRVGEGQGDLPARPQARHEAGRDLRCQRRLHRRGPRPDPRAGPEAPGGSGDLQPGRRLTRPRPLPRAAQWARGSGVRGVGGGWRRGEHARAVAATVSSPEHGTMTGSPVALVGVYDADGGVAGELRYVIGHLLGTAHCSLCDITHSAVRRKPAWDRMIARLGVPVVLLHRNETPAHLAAAVAEAGAPCVLVELDDGTVTPLLRPRDLETLGGSVDAFEARARSALATFAAPSDHPDPAPIP